LKYLLHRCTLIAILEKIHSTGFTAMKTRSSGTAKSTARPSCLVGVLYHISQERICWWL